MEKKKIFIIDDDLTFLKLLKILFEKENYSVITDQSCSNFCNKIKMTSPDIILLDLLMPENNGFQIFKKMKKDNYCASIPVVILTSHQNVNSKMQLLREGVLDYIYKPFHKEELLLRMRNYIRYCTDGKKNSLDDGLLFKQLREIIMSHQKQWIEPQINKQSQCGYIYQDIRLVSDHTIYGKERDLLEKWAEQNLLDRALLDIVELCPVCYHYNISMNYVCPICGSINLNDDSPSNNGHGSFSCNDCGMKIKVPQWRYHCLNCDEKFNRDKVIRQKIYKYCILDLKTPGKTEATTTPSILTIEKMKKITTIPSPNSLSSRPNLYFIKKKFILDAFNESKISFISNQKFNEQVSREIDSSHYNHEDFTVMSIGIENLYHLSLKVNYQSVVKIFKAILQTIVRYQRPDDVLSFDGDRHKILILLPRTHLKIAKIIGERIQQKLDRFRTTFPLEIKLASYPQDGRTAEELLEMMEMGIVKIDNYAFA